MLVIVQTHPVPYHAPVFRALSRTLHAPLTVVYASDFSVAGYRDREFGTSFAWDADLLGGYDSLFLSRVAEGGARSYEEVSPAGLGTALGRLQPSAVMVCGYGHQLHRAALLRAWLHGWPILFRAETIDREPRLVVKRVLRRHALAAVYARCARLLYIGVRSRRHFEQHGCRPDQLVFSPYCADVSSFHTTEASRAALRESGRRAVGAEAADLVVLFAGKLSPRKRPDLLVDALARRQARSGRRALLAFVGDGVLKVALEERARSAGLRVHFAGFQNQTQLSRYYHAADLFVLPSGERETWGVVVNEALAHAVPCVVSDAVGCAPDLVVPGRTGERFEADSVGGLEAALERAASLAGRDDVRRWCRAMAAEYSV